MASGIFTLRQLDQALTVGAWSNQKPVNVDYLVVAGGGSGGGGAGYAGGGGGGGGLLQGNTGIEIGSSITVTIGAGGTADAGQFNGTSGSNSVFGQIAAVGGGYGSYGQGNAGAAGGSGGGSGANLSGPGQGTAGQGFAGGYGWPTTTAPGGGGGGAGTAGLNATSGVAGAGGAGISSDISGIRTAYSGGGGGSATNAQANAGGAGGAGGGGTGGNAATTTNGTAGTANTGGGGGGSGNFSTRIGGNGGSGIVILSYPDIYQAAASTTGSPTVSTSGSGSLYFNTSPYLSTPSNSGFNFGTGDFTIEFWVNSGDVTSGAQRGMFQTSDTAGGLKTSYTTGVQSIFGVNGNGSIGANVGGTNYNSSSGIVTTSTWYHVAITRQSGTVNVWLNGTSVASGTGNTANLSGTYCSVGGYYSTTYLLNGYLSNFRVVKGTALYTASFTPSTIPLTAVTNTQLLLSTVSGALFADSSVNSLTLSANNGTPTWNASSPFATGLGYKNRTYKWTSSGSITF